MRCWARHLPCLSPRVRQSIALFLCICRILGVPASQVSPFSCVNGPHSAPLAGQFGRVDPQQSHSGLSADSSHSAFSLSFCSLYEQGVWHLGHVPASLSCSLPHSEIRVSWLCVNQFCPWGWFSSLVWEVESKLDVTCQQVQPYIYTWVTSVISLPLKVWLSCCQLRTPLLLSATDSLLLTSLHCWDSAPAPPPQESPLSSTPTSILQLQAGSGNLLCVSPMPSLGPCDLNLLHRIRLLPLCSCVSVHLIISAWWSTEHLIYLCQVINT